MNRVKRALPPIVAGIGSLLLWEFNVLHFIFRLEVYQLPLPSEIIRTFIENIETLTGYGLITLAEAVLGIIMGSLIGFFIAVIATMFPRWGFGGLILITALNAIPIVALAPIMNLWFGDGIGARAAVVTITTMAAMAIHTHRGLTNLPTHALDLMKSYSADKKTIFRSLRLPNSVPYILTALKINTTVGMIGAIVSEFFYSSKGLGYMLSNSIKIAKMSMGWACILFSAILGILLYVTVVLIERRVLSWHVSQRT